MSARSARSWCRLAVVIGALVAAGARPPAASAGDPLVLRNYGPAPDFAGITAWLNSGPLTIEGLRGKVVLIDFWTYACANCARTLPHVAAWFDRYQADGLEVVGVHTPELPFERDTENLKAAIDRLGLRYPVAQDNRYETWKAYANRDWPAVYLVARDGTLVFAHAGEGDYEQIESAIKAALARRSGD